jgi:hypothetical protein
MAVTQIALQVTDPVATASPTRPRAIRQAAAFNMINTTERVATTLAKWTPSFQGL